MQPDLCRIMPTNHNDGVTAARLSPANFPLVPIVHWLRETTSLPPLTTHYPLHSPLQTTLYPSIDTLVAVAKSTRPD